MMIAFTVSTTPEIMPELTNSQLNMIAGAYANRVVDEMTRKELELAYYELLVDSFSSQGENDIYELISTVYGEDYWNELVKEAVEDSLYWQ